MTTKKMFCLLALILASAANYAQTREARAALKHEFTKDSLGCLGKRLSYIDTSATYVDTDTHEVRKKILVAGIDLADQKEGTVIETLGRPNSSSVRFHTNPEIEEVVLSYYLSTCGRGKPGKTLVFRIYNGDIDSIVIEEQ